MKPVASAISAMVWRRCMRRELCALDAALDNVLMNGHADRVAKESAEVRCAETGDGCDGCQ